MTLAEAKKYNELKLKLQTKFGPLMSESPTRCEIIAVMLYERGSAMTSTGIARKTGIPANRLKELLTRVLNEPRYEAETAGSGLAQVYRVSKIQPKPIKPAEPEVLTAKDMTEFAPKLAMSKWNSSLRLK